MTNRLAPLSMLSFIKIKDSNPLTLFAEWKKQVDACNSNPASKWFVNVFCLATISPDGKPRNRNVLLKEFDNGFIFATDKRGGKMKDILNNPNVAATFVWNYDNEGLPEVKQVRIEGIIQMVNEEKSKSIYDEELPYGKIRSHFCHQGTEIKWENAKKEHDELLQKYLNGETKLPKPDHYVGLKIIPTQMEFYFAEKDSTGDRIIFTKSDDTWKYVRVAP